MKTVGMPVWVKNGDYQRTFKYRHADFDVVWAWVHRNLYNILETVTVAEVSL